MKPRNNSKFIAGPFKAATTLLILLLLVCFVQFIITQIAFAFTYKYQPVRPIRTEDPLWRIPRSKKNFLPDGTIHLVNVRDEYRGPGEDYRKEQVYDANGNLLWEGIHKDRPYEYLSWSGYLDSSFNDRQMRNMQMISPESSKMLEIPVNSQRKTELVWRYDPGEDLFVGYRLRDGKIGYFGATGFTESKSKAKPFGKFKLFTAWTPKDSFSPTLLWQTERRIYEINFEKQQVQLLFESVESNIKRIDLHKWRFLSVDSPDASNIEYRPAIHCLTEDGKYHLLLRQPQQRLTITLPDDLHSDSVKLTATKQGIFLHYSGSEARPPEGCSRSSKAWQRWWRNLRKKPYKRWVELYKVDNEGGLELLTRFDWTVPGRSPANVMVMADPWSRIRIRSYVTKVSPPVYDLAWYLFEAKLYQLARQGIGMTSGYAGIVEHWRPGNSILNWLLGAAMMGFALWHGWSRRTSWGKVIFWLVLVGAFNLAGLLTYLALNHIPVIRCPACGKRRGLGQVDCVRCGAELPAPDRGKLELIFNT